MLGFRCSHFYCVNYCELKWLIFTKIISLILEFFFSSSLSHLELKFPPNYLFFQGKDWVESQRTKIKTMGNINGDFEFHTKSLFQFSIFFWFIGDWSFQFSKITFQYQNSFPSFSIYFCYTRYKSSSDSSLKRKIHCLFFNH